MKQLSMFDATTIELTRGFMVLVDPIDSDLAQYKWSCIGIDRWPAAMRRVHIAGRRKTVYMHRVILERVIGRTLDTKEMVDHIDGNSLNNRRSNLRIVTNAQNLQNRSKTKFNTSGFKGVSWTKGHWAAQIGENGQRHHLGLFDTPEQAYQAYCEAAKLYHGEFARLE